MPPERKKKTKKKKKVSKNDCMTSAGLEGVLECETFLTAAITEFIREGRGSFAL